MALAGLAGSAYATNGYFSHGYGMKAKGMAGASTTNTDDAFFGANNPAAAALPVTAWIWVWICSARFVKPAVQVVPVLTVQWILVVIFQPKAIPIIALSLSLATTGWSTTTWRWA